MSSFLMALLITTVILAYQLNDYLLRAETLVLLSPSPSLPLSPPLAAATGVNEDKQRDIGIVLVPGALIANSAYKDLGLAIQSKLLTAGIRANVAIPKIMFNMPLGMLGAAAIKNGIAALEQQGLSTTSPIYLMGHSLGARSAFNYYLGQLATNGTGAGTGTGDREWGLVTFGFFPERRQRQQSSQKVHSMMFIGGELDGLSRVTRAAEEFYHRNLASTSADGRRQQVLPFQSKCRMSCPADLDEGNQNRTQSAVVVMEGFNHMSFASGPPTSFIQHKDLRAEISISHGHQLLGDLVASFISGNDAAIQAHLHRTHDLLKPIIAAYELEGSLHFNRPIQKWASNCPQGICGVGSDWVSIYAQPYLVDLPFIQANFLFPFSVTSSDSFVWLASLPPVGQFHHPHFHVDTANHTIDIATYSQCGWNAMDWYIDGGFRPTSAEEIGAKMNSKQCAFVKALGANKSDLPIEDEKNANLCAQVNRLAYDWALQHIHPKAKERFVNYGQNLTFIEDINVKTGFTWTYGNLRWVKDENSTAMTVQSIAMVTDIESKPVPIVAPNGSHCYHYCKLLSPARALEWMMVEGLRQGYGIQP